MLTAPAPSAEALPALTVPLVMVVPPVNTLEPESVKAPAPVLIKLAALLPLLEILPVMMESLRELTTTEPPADRPAAVTVPAAKFKAPLAVTDCLNVMLLATLLPYKLMALSANGPVKLGDRLLEVPPVEEKTI